MNNVYLESHRNSTIRVEMDEMENFYHDKRHQIWLWRAIDHRSDEEKAFWLGRREHKNLDKVWELLRPLNLGKVYTDGTYAYYERFPSEVLVVTKQKRQKIERDHLWLRNWCARLVRKGIRFSKTEQTYQIVVALTINVWFLVRLCLIQ